MLGGYEIGVLFYVCLAAWICMSLWATEYYMDASFPWIILTLTIVLAFDLPYLWFLIFYLPIGIVWQFIWWYLELRSERNKLKQKISTYANRQEFIEDNKFSNFVLDGEITIPHPDVIEVVVNGILWPFSILTTLVPNIFSGLKFVFKKVAQYFKSHMDKVRDNLVRKI